MTAESSRHFGRVSRLQDRLGYRFHNPGLLRQALTHRSYTANRPAAVTTNERLEFLGDAVLGFLVAERLFSARPTATEGELTRARSRLVNRTTLAAVARDLHLSEVVLVGKGVRLEGGHQLDSILANTYEALLGAAYLDGGIEVCGQLLAQWLHDNILLAEEQLTEKDAKSLLQEAIQSTRKVAPTYVLLDVPSEDDQFYVEAHVNGVAIGKGMGKTKGEAEQAAARQALESIGNAD